MLGKLAMNKESGQISLIEIVGIASAIFIAGIGGWIAQTYRTDDKIADVNIEVNLTKERTARLEEAIITIKEDNKEIKSDVKTLLNKVNGK